MSSVLQQDLWNDLDKSIYLWLSYMRTSAMKVFSLKISEFSRMFSDDLCVCHECFPAIGSEDAGFSVTPS